MTCGNIKQLCSVATMRPGLILVLLIALPWIQCQVFLSVSKLSLMSSVETNLTIALRNYVRECQKNAYMVPEFITRFLEEAEVNKDKVTCPHYMENPINAFHFLKRIGSDWPKLDEFIIGEECPLAHPCHSYSVRRSVAWKTVGVHVSSVDVKYAALALVRLWRTYQLDLPQLFSGRILETQTDALTGDEVLLISSHMIEDGLYFYARDWLKSFLETLNTNDVTSDNVRIYRITSKALARIYLDTGYPAEAKNVIERSLLIDPNSQSLRKDLEFYTLKTEEGKISSVQDRADTTDHDYDPGHYRALCRGEGNRSVAVLSKLRCQYRPTRVPYYRVREEIFSYSPRLSLLYNVITDTEMNDIKNLASKSLLPSYVVKSSDGAENSADYKTRVSETAWFEDQTSPVVRRLSRRIALVTGLSTQYDPKFSHAEPMQVLNYGIGGMYIPHIDHLLNAIDVNPYREADPEHLRHSGDRIATWMFYLNDVTAGGSTVFVNMNVTVPVVKGSAAFWYNYKRNGEGDERTRHAGCPVLIGSKWVANKWIRQTGQIFNRKCGKRPGSIDLPLGA